MTLRCIPVANIPLFRLPAKAPCFLIFVLLGFEWGMGKMPPSMEFLLNTLGTSDFQ